LTRLILSASSEIDVVLKLLCNKLDPTINHRNIINYRDAIKLYIPDLINEGVYLYKYKLLFYPWRAWRGTKNPKWWTNYNKIKHQRNSSYNKANLENALKAVSALLVVITYYCKILYEQQTGKPETIKNTIYALNLDRRMISLDSDYYPCILVTE
jgi:hypothetical protein